MDKLTGVRNISKRGAFSGSLYGAKLHFAKDEVQMLPVELAHKLFKHADVFKPAKAVKVDKTKVETETAQTEAETTTETNTQVLDMHDQIQQMDKNALEDFAKAKYGQDLDKRKSVETLRQEVGLMIDQFGVV